MKRTLLPVGFNDIEIRKLSTAVEVFEADIVPIYEDGYGRTIGSFLGLPVAGDGAGGFIDGQMVIISGFEQDELNALLYLMMNAGFSRNILKAIVTHANISWTVSELWNELSEEHRQMNR